MRRSKRLAELRKSRTAASENIISLFVQARKVFSKDPVLANRYVEMARRMSMKLKVRIPSEQKRQFCKHCYSYLMPGKNCRVRTNTKTISYFCEKCRKFSRIPYKNRKQD